MTSLRGYFNGFDRRNNDTISGDTYCVYIGDSADTEYTEITMAGDSPFVVTYETSESPFEPIRTSTATISIVADTYFEEFLPSTALETPVWFYNETRHELLWCGYLTPKVYDNNYTECYETVQLEAADCLSVLQYVDYTPVSGVKGIQKLNDIIGRALSETRMIDAWYIVGEASATYKTTRHSGTTNQTLWWNAIYCPNLSEQNFYSSDTDEPWSCQEVLEEIARYFGYTIIQRGSAFFFLDYKYIDYHYGSTLSFKKSFGTNYRSMQSVPAGNFTWTLSSGDIRSNSASISFMPVYNKCVVKDNMYAVESIIPGLFNDNNLVNRLDPDDFYKSVQLTVPSPQTPSYPKGSVFIGLGQNYHDDPDTKLGKASGDTVYSYYLREYNHKKWKSRYISSLNTSSTITNEEYYPTTQASLVTWAGGTVVDLGVVKNNYISDYGQKIVASKLDFTRYLMISQQNLGIIGNSNPGWDTTCFFYSGETLTAPFNPDNSYLVIKGSAIFEKYFNRPYINPDWETGTTIVGGANTSQVRTDGCLKMGIGIGRFYWNGSSWSESGGTVTAPPFFTIVTEKSADTYGQYNTERHILNNVSYELGIGEDGYIIPLSGIAYNAGAKNFTVRLYLPGLQNKINGVNQYNGFCWLKDFDIKLCQKGQDLKANEGDMVYENVIIGSAVNDLREITCRLTTYTEDVSPSYSTVLGVCNPDASDPDLYPILKIKPEYSTDYREPEYNIVQKYVDQFSTPTKKITLDIDAVSDWNGSLSATGLGELWTLYKNVDIDNPNQLFCEIGAEIDYKAGIRTTTLMEIK